jgi:hypothetical protein
VDNPNFVLWYSLISHQMALGGVRNGDIFVHQPPDLPIHPETGAQAFSHPPNLGTVTSLEDRADAGHPRDSGSEKTGSEQMAMQNRDVFAADERSRRAPVSTSSRDENSSGRHLTSAAESSGSIASISAPGAARHGLESVRTHCGQN